MKKYTKWLLAAMAFSVGFVFSGCSDDDGGVQMPQSPLFDEPLELRCNAGSVETIEFDSNISWTMVSNAIWCSLSLDGETYFYDLSGTAGVSKVYVKIGDEAQGFEEATTELTLVREGVSEVIANIYRNPKEYALFLTDEQGEEKNTVEIMSNGSVNFSVEANFEFGISDKPEWIKELTITPDATVANKKNFHAVVNEEYEAFPCEGTLTFMNNDNTVSYPYVITYTGMEPNQLKIDGVNPWGWIVSPDGITFSNESSLSGESQEHNGSLSYKVKSLKNETRYLCFAEEGESITLLSEEECWLHVSVDAVDASLVTVYADAYPPMTEGSRKAYLFAVPAASYDELIALYNTNPNTSFVDEKYNHVMLEATQTSDYVEPGKGFDVKDGMLNTLDCFEETEQTYLSLIKDKFGLDEVYAVSVEPGTYINAFPHLTDLHWEGWNSDNTLLVDAQGNAVDKSTVSLEVGMNMNDEYYISMMAHTSPVIIVLKGVDGEYIKALVVKSSVVLDPGTGFIVKYRMVEDIPCALETDMDIAAFIIKNYGVHEIYSVKTRVGRTLQIFPHLTEAEWNGGSFSSIIITDTSGNTILPADVSYEAALDGNDDFYASIRVKRNTFILIFVGVDGRNIKAMVVKAE